MTTIPLSYDTTTAKALGVVADHHGKTISEACSAMLSRANAKLSADNTEFQRYAKANMDAWTVTASEDESWMNRVLSNGGNDALLTSAMASLSIQYGITQGWHFELFKQPRRKATGKRNKRNKRSNGFS